MANGSGLTGSVPVHLYECTLCGQQFASDAPFNHTGTAQNPITPPDITHPEADWEAYRVAQGVGVGEPYARRIIVGADVPPITPPPESRMK